MMEDRRKFLRLCGLATVGTLAGCSEIDIDESQANSPSTSNLGNANFTFEYVPEREQVRIQYNGTADIIAGDLQVRSSNDLQVQWSQLGSTVAGANDLIAPDATAVLGVDIINWGEPVDADETIRLVHTGRDAPATLGRFTPPEPSPLTSTVPQTGTSTPDPTDSPTTSSTPTPTETPTAEPIDTSTASSTPTPTETPTTERIDTPTTTSTSTPTETPTPESDTTPPSISAFSLSNPTGQTLRTSFDSDEPVVGIEVSISGAESTVLTESDFSESVSNGVYSYEATYEASSDGDYTAVLAEATDGSENDGASDESVTVSVTTTETTSSVTLAFRHELNGDFSDSANSITGEPASDGYEFVEDRNGTVLELSGSGMSTSGGYYSIPQDAVAEYFSTGDPFTIAQWVKPENNEEWEMIHSAPSAAINTRFGNIRMNDFDNGSNQYVADADVAEYLPNNEWSHVVGTVEPGESADLYVDGELVGTDSADEDRGFRTNEGQTHAVGYHGDDVDGGFDSHFTGRIDDVRFYNGAMDAEQVQTLYQETDTDGEA
jgi:hypothetical protein